MLDLQRSVMGLCYAFGPIWKIRFYSLPFPFLGNPLDGMGGAAPPQPLYSIPSLYTLSEFDSTTLFIFIAGGGWIWGGAEVDENQYCPELTCSPFESCLSS